MRITPTMENYMETILLLERANGLVRVTDIADKMCVAKSSVHVALHSLEDRDMLTHEKYGSIHLTELGRTTAEAVYQRHVSLTAFFVRIVGLDPKTAEEEACAVEHVLSEAAIARMSELADKAT